MRQLLRFLAQLRRSITLIDLLDLLPVKLLILLNLAEVKFANYWPLSLMNFQLVNIDLRLFYNIAIQLVCLMRHLVYWEGLRHLNTRKIIILRTHLSRHGTVSFTNLIHLLRPFLLAEVSVSKFNNTVWARYVCLWYLGYGILRLIWQYDLIIQHLLHLHLYFFVTTNLIFKRVLIFVLWLLKSVYGILGWFKGALITKVKLIDLIHFYKLRCI